jgi:hypothetical protein
MNRVSWLSTMFNIKTSIDFYAKLVDDFDSYMIEPHSARLALTCAMTAFHLHEWVWGDWLRDDQAVKATLSIGTRRQFLAWIDSVCPWFPVVQKLTNGTKHFDRHQGFETLVVKAAPFAFDQIAAGFDQGAWDRPVPYPSGLGLGGEGCLLIDFGEGAGEHRWQPAAHILEAVVRFWRDFFKQYRAASILPSSKHHCDYQMPPS